jgi:hypothetical protein
MFSLLFKPAALFAALKEKPGRQWWLPLILVTVLSLAGGALLLSRLDIASAIEESITDSGKSIPPEAMDQAVEMGGKITRVMMVVGGLIGPVFVYCIAAAWLWLSCNLQKKPTTFLHMLGLYAWTDMVNLPRHLLGLVGILRAGEINSFKTLTALTPFTPLSFMGDVSGMNLALIGLLSKFNLFTLAHLALLALGLSAMTGLSRARAAIVALLPWLMGVGWAALQFALHRGS